MPTISVCNPTWYTVLSSTVLSGTLNCNTGKAELPRLNSDRLKVTYFILSITHFDAFAFKMNISLK